MLLLTSTSDKIVLNTSAAGSIQVHASWADNLASVVTPGRTNTAAITTATNTDVVAAPAAATQRNLRNLSVRNTHASITNVVTVTHTDGTNSEVLLSVTLLASESLVLDEIGKWTHYDSNGAPYQRPADGEGAYNGFTAGFFKTGTAADAVGYWYCTSKDTGFPGAWAPGTPGLTGRTTDGTASADFGCITIPNAATGVNYLTDITIASSTPHTHMFFDVLWVNSGLVITTTTGQTVTSGTFPARDVNGSSDGVGLMIGILCTAAVGLAAVASNATVTYTNSEGTGSRTATLTAQVGSQAPATPVIGTIIWFNLQAGDRGVRQVNTVTLGTSWVSGTISLIVARPILYVGTTVANFAGQSVGMNAAPGIRLFSGTCLLHCVLASATTATLFAGSLTVEEK